MPTNLGTLIAGKGITADSNGNLADPLTIANPDNVKFSELYRSLFIGEDCSLHVTCMLWADNVDTKVLTRLATVPAGAEVTGLSIEDDINGFSYITANFQHAGDYRAPLHNAAKAAGVEALIKANYNNYDAATIGYLASKTSAGAVATQVQPYVTQPKTVGETIKETINNLPFLAFLIIIPSAAVVAYCVFFKKNTSTKGENEDEAKMIKNPSLSV